MPESGKTIAVVGGGAIGGYAAAALHRAGRDVTLCVRTAFDRLVIVEGDEERAVDLRIATDPAAVGPVDWTLVATKAQDVPGTADWLRALTGDGTVTAAIQNGVDHERRLRPYLPPSAPVLPAVVYCGAERLAPGRIVHHGMARLAVPDGAAGAGFADLFAGSVFEVERVADFTTVAWRKLLSNAVGNPITALTLRRSSVFRDPRVHDLARDVLAEVVAVARAEGAAITMADADETLARLGQSRGSGSSMLYDRLAQRPLEHEFLTGAVVAAAEAHGIAVPLNRALLALAGAASGHPLDASR